MPQASRTELPIEDKVVLEHALTRLKEIEQKVLYSFYYEDRSQTDIAKALGVSNNYVSHILKNSARKLQQMFRSDAVREAALQHERKRRRMAAHGAAAVAEEADDAPPTVVDPVTGLYTRHYFDDRLDEELSRASRHHLELSVIRVRVEGDLPEAALFARIAQTVKDCMRRSDLVARYEEHELIALLPHTGATRETVIARLRDASWRAGGRVSPTPAPSVWAAPPIPPSPAAPTCWRRRPRGAGVARLPWYQDTKAPAAPSSAAGAFLLLPFMVWRSAWGTGVLGSRGFRLCRSGRHRPSVVQRAGHRGRRWKRPRPRRASGRGAGTPAMRRVGCQGQCGESLAGSAAGRSGAAGRRLCLP